MTEKIYISNLKVRPRGKRQIMLEKKIQKILSAEVLKLHRDCITLTDIDISPDCKKCVLIVSSIMLDKKTCLDFIGKNLYLLQKYLAAKISTKFTPKLSAKWDDTHEKFLQLQQALNK